MGCSKWEQDNEYIKVTDVFELIDVVSTNLLITSKYKYFGPDEVRYFLMKLKQEILGYLEEEENNAC